MRITMTVNGATHDVDDVWEGESLLYVLRERMGLPGSKNACEQGECGSCTVYLDGVLACSCLVPAGQAHGRAVVTVEGLADGAEGADGAGAAGGELHPVQQAFVEAGAVQCGFCTPGLVVTARTRRTRRSGRRWRATSAAAPAWGSRRPSPPAGGGRGDPRRHRAGAAAGAGAPGTPHGLRAPTVADRLSTS